MTALACECGGLGGGGRRGEEGGEGGGLDDTAPAPAVDTAELIPLLNAERRAANSSCLIAASCLRSSCSSCRRFSSSCRRFSSLSSMYCRRVSKSDGGGAAMVVSDFSGVDETVFPCLFPRGDMNRACRPDPLLGVCKQRNNHCGRKYVQMQMGGVAVRGDPYARQRKAAALRHAKERGSGPRAVTRGIRDARRSSVASACESHP